MVSEADEVNGKWNAMKDVLLKATEAVCGRTKGHRRRRETWWWNDVVDQAICDKRKCYKLWKKSGLETDNAA